MHTLPSNIPEEVRKMLIGTTHRYAKVREVALKMSNTIITSFAALMCNREIVFTLLEILTLMRRSCEDELTDEYSVTHVYRSERLKLELVLTDDFAVRNDITTRLYSSARKWLSLATSRAPIEMQSILQVSGIELGLWGKADATNN
jgi:phosphatidylinositol 4-kinase